MSVIVKRPWTQQPQFIPSINWSHPSARGLVFCAWPVGSTFIDLVTGVVGTKTGTMTPDVYTSNGGKVVGGTFANVVKAGSVSTDQVIWPVSLQRGGNIVQTGTILSLAGVTEQVDGRLYPIGGNTESVSNGDGFSMAMDSLFWVGRGNILRCRYNAAPIGNSTALLGNPFGPSKLHFFGYSFAGNGENGTWLAEGTGVTWTGGTVHGTATTNRRAIVHNFSDGLTSGTKAGAVALLLIFDRTILTDEYARLYKNVWQLFAPLSRRLWAPAAAAPGGFQAAWASQRSGVIGAGVR